MLELPSEDPNRDSTDPMIPEYWLLAEAVQDRILAAGYEAPTVEGIAVDIHDLLQAADRIREVLAPALIASEAPRLSDQMQHLSAELTHIRWHCGSAETFLSEALESISARAPATP